MKFTEKNIKRFSCSAPVMATTCKQDGQITDILAKRTTPTYNWSTVGGLMVKKKKRNGFLLDALTLYVTKLVTKYRTIFQNHTNDRLTHYKPGG